MEASRSGTMHKVCIHTNTQCMRGASLFYFKETKCLTFPPLPPFRIIFSMFSIISIIFSIFSIFSISMA